MHLKTEIELGAPLQCFLGLISYLSCHYSGTNNRQKLLEWIDETEIRGTRAIGHFDSGVSLD